MTDDQKQLYRVEQWNSADGENLLRFNHDLNQNSVIFDVGGYKGETTEEFLKRYNCEVYIFEPVAEFAQIIKEKFQNNPKVHIFEFGLSNKTTTKSITLEENAASVYKKNEDSEKISLVKISDFIRENKIAKIDLMDINIEGSEFDLIQDLIESGDINKVDNLQVQFHWFVNNAEKKMRDLQNKLTDSHFLTFEHKFVWENWKKYDKKDFTEKHSTNIIMSYTNLLEESAVSKNELIEIKKVFSELNEEMEKYKRVVESYSNKLDSRSHKIADDIQGLFSKIKNLIK